VTLSKESRVGIAFALIVAIGVATGPPWWFKSVGLSSSDTATSSIVGMSGGCAPYQIFAQGRWRPTGTAIRSQPNVLSTIEGSFSANASISVNGWVHGRPAYTTNISPWNSDVWFHLTDGAGWVSFPGVRGTPIAFDPTGLADGGTPAADPKGCEGAIQ
jgi:hypothetical protein